MKCSKCGKEMRKGYLFCSKDGAFSFANEVPDHRTNVAANCCEECRIITIEY